MPKTSTPDPIKVRVLTPCVYGVANDVVTLDAASAQAAQELGIVDSTPEAVAYAESIAASGG